MAAAAIGKLLRRGGRSSTSSSHLLPAHRPSDAAGGLTPLLGSPPAAPAAGTRRLMNTGSFPSNLNMLKNNYCMQTKGSYQPYNSMYVILDLQKKVYKIGQETKLCRRRWGFSSVLVAVFAVMALTVWGVRVHGDKEANKKTLTELKQSLAKTECGIEKLKISINELKKMRIVSDACENH